MKFSPCIDLYRGQVSQIIGNSIDKNKQPKINFVTSTKASFFAKLFKDSKLDNGHIMMLDDDNKQQCLEAVQAYPEGLRVGGINSTAQARFWLDQGAKAVVLSADILGNQQSSWEKLEYFSKKIGKKNIVMDLALCLEGKDIHIYNRSWQHKTGQVLNTLVIAKLSKLISGIIIHSIKKQGLCQGVDAELLAATSKLILLPTVYCGGVSSIADIEIIKELGQGRIDFTVGSSLDIYGGKGLHFSYLAKKYNPASLLTTTNLPHY